MKVRLWIPLCAALALATVWPGDRAHGATVSGRASTVLEWFDHPGGDTAVPLYQYLLLNARDLTGNGLNFQGYGRLSRDLNDRVDADSRLYYAYLEQKRLLANLDARLGRQFIGTTAGASLMDGLLLKYRTGGRLGFSLFGGGDVKYHDSYDADDLIVGTEVTGKYLADDLTVGLSYVHKRDDGDVSAELFGLDVDYQYQESLNLYSETQFNWLTDGITYFLGGATYHAAPRWTLRGEYLYSLPVFSATSIFSVFAVAEYEEVLAELSYKLGPGLNSFLRTTYEIYPEFDNARVVEAGVEKIRTDRLSGYLAGVLRLDDEGQDLKGIKARLACQVTKMWQAGVGAHLDHLERRLEDNSDTTTSSRLWTDVTGDLTKKTSIQAKLERVESDLWDEYYRGQLRLNIRF